jgi:N-acetylmuramate 1-kinase
MKPWLTKTLLYGGIGARRYYRVTTSGDSYVLMDAGDDRLAVALFKTRSLQWGNLNLRAPSINVADESAGSVLMEDFGDRHLLAALTNDTADALYATAMCDLQQLQGADRSVFDDFPWGAYQEKLQRAAQHVPLSQRRRWYSLCDQLVLEVKSQPQVVCHHDFHAMNIMCLPGDVLGYLDFQDLSLGPLTYDLASLLMDCYIEWPYERVCAWRDAFFDHLRDKRGMSRAHFCRTFDLTALMRHLRCYTLFVAREKRDKRLPYADYIKRSGQYITRACDAYPEYEGLRLEGL